jgi:hypothetical protein
MEFGPPLYPLEFQHKTIESYLYENLDIIEECLEDYVPEMLESYLHDDFNQYQNVLKFATLLDPELAENSEFLAVCYNSARLGFLIADSALPHALSVTYKGVIEDVSSQEAIIEQFLKSSEQALAKSPYFEGQVGKFNHNIDPSSKYSHFVDIFAGHALAVLDNGERYVSINDEVNQFHIELEQWEGSL